ncbi:hypothetical protein BRD00_00615 [Halobacteriales archaeon QS_8_69_26]|nr:MAG: hypothetical protein BRD00_00615 [Halobacteriales archaeon QS_8_69_26]
MGILDGIRDGIRGILGTRAEADATSGADPEDLFGMSTAYVTMGADLGYEVGEAAALCFSGVNSTDFEDTVEEVIDILEVGRDEFGTEAYLHEDDHGYHWVVLEDTNFEDLVTSIHFAADTFIERGYGARLLAALFAFEKDDQRAYWVYSFRRGSFYPFAPEDPAERERDRNAEFKLQSLLEGELDVEEDKEYWYPLWPSTRHGHPWE